MAIKVVHLKIPRTRYAFKLIDSAGDEITVVSPMCNCMACEFLSVTTEDGTKDVFALDNQITEALWALAEYVGKQDA